ncbi:MAG: hypothetical protein WCJ30_22015, partial [Deltaproteobacteria bacterium]
TLVLDDGTLVEGSLDLAFRDARDPETPWTVVEFKTDLDAVSPTIAQQYLRQLALYVRAVARATGETARGVLLGV